MFVFPVKTPKFIQRLFPKYLWKKASLQKEIYLTFDDGPTPEITQWTLDLLKQYKAKATFFCIGHNIEKHPEIFNSILKDNHTIGNHTFNHLKGWKTNNEAYIDNVIKTENILKQALTNYHANFTTKEKLNSAFWNLEFNDWNLKNFRPPFGKIKRRQAKTLLKKGYRIVMWSVISYDWNQKISPENCLKIVLKNTKSGSIVVFHDSIKASKNMQHTLPKVLEHFSQKGYVFKAL